MLFKKIRSILLPYEVQGYIWFLCQTVNRQPAAVRDRISDMCVNVAGMDYEALWAVLTDKSRNVSRISMDYYIPEKRLYRMRKEFYEAYAQRYLKK